MANNWQINAIVGLDGTQSRNQLNSDIKGLARNLDKLKLYAEIDKNQVMQLQHQLKNLQVQLNNVTVSDAVINGLVAKINAGLQNVNIGNINVGNVSNQAQQVGQQIGNNIGQQITQSISSAIQKGTMKGADGQKDLSKYIPSGKLLQNDVAKEALKDFQALGVGIVTVKEEMKNIDGKNLLNGFTINIKNAKGEVESLRYALTDIEGKTGKMFQYVGGSINDNGVIQQMNSISAKADSLQTKLDKLKANYSDLNASRPIKDSGNISTLSQQYDKVVQAIENVRSADNATFSSMVSNAQREITTLETMITQFRNAENVATQMKSVDISSGIAQAQERLGKLKANASGFEQMTETIRKLDTAIEGVGDKASLDKFINDLRTAETQLSRVKAETKQLENVNKIQLSTDITKIENDYKRFGIVSQEVENNLKELKIARENALKAKGTDRASAEIEKYNQKLAETKSSWKELQATQVSANQRTSQMTEMQEWMRKNKNATKLCGDQVERLIKECQTCDKVRFDGIKNEFKELQVQAGKAGKLGNTLWGSLIEQGKGFIQWTGVSGVVMGVSNKIRQAVTELKELDNILTEIDKTSNLTGQQLDKLGDTSFDTASKYGRIASDLLTGVQEMSRSGFYGKQGSDMAEKSLLAQTAGDMSKDLANNYILATNAAYKLNGSAKELNKILDGQNLITNRNSVSMEDMATAMSEAGTVASSYRVSIEDLSAMIGTIESVTKLGGSEVGNAIKAILINLQNVSSSKIVNTLNAANASMTEMINGTEKLRDPISILRDLAKTFNELDEDDPLRAEILTNIGQKYHATKLGALLQNMEMYDKMLVDYSEGEGSAFNEAQKSANNLEGSINKLSNSWTKLVNTFINAKTLTSGVNVLNGLTNGVQGLIEKIGLLTTAIVGIGTVWGTIKQNNSKSGGLMSC